MGFFDSFIKGLKNKEDSEVGNTSVFGKSKLSDTVTEKSFSKLKRDGENYFFTNTVQYQADRTFKAETSEKVFSFAYKMTFGEEGAHRGHRSGGTHLRKKGEIFANTFQGKLAECAACNFFHTLGYRAVPDFSAYDLGKWDTVDISVGGKEFSVKSTKSFGQLMLLETKDWDENARYVPNEEKGEGEYDAFIFIRLSPSCEDILKKNRLLYSNTAEQDALKELLLKEDLGYNCVGFVTREDLKYIIRKGYVLPKGAMLNGSTRMDAENYYVQSGDMRPMSELKDVLGQ